MKKIVLTLTAFTFMAGVLLISCNTPAEKVENAKQNVTEAEEKLADAREAYLNDIDSYRAEAAAKITANNQSIADFNARIESEKKEAKDDYKKKIAALDQKNSDMKKALDEYKANGKENWEKFKDEFNRDMDELGKSFKDLTVKNVNN